MQFKRTVLSLSVAVGLMASYSGVQASDTGFYTGVRYGKGQYKVSSPIDSKKDKTSDQGLKILAGYKFSPRLSLRADYTQFGSPVVNYGTDLNGPITASSYGMAGVFHIPVPIINPYGKIGVQKWTLENQKSLPNFNKYFSRHKGTNMYYGVGTGIKIFPYTTLDFEYENYSVGNDEMDYVSAGVTVNF